MRYSPTELVELRDKQGYIIIPVNSSVIEQIAYSLLDKFLIVTINGSDYSYYNVPFHLFVKFVNADSKGSFYNHHIKGKW